ncbi:MAG: hypothetical protein ABIE47_08135 [Pseudomonadota bacterium]
MTGKHLESILQSIFFSQDRDEPTRNPNDPADQPYFYQMRHIENKAFKAWYEDAGGEYLIRNMEKNLIGKIINLVVKDVKGIKDILEMVEIKKEIMRDVTFIDRIRAAFFEEEKRLAEIKHEVAA